ncbi:glutathione-dependent formaldehyde dehydrogenase [Bdellovibrio sp. SKB1291214]|uniref:zinc-dependent alcohol dehydrogenase n=1 Tax=Bdellovibrio sp. SKB1291214 TaxID=1732569 RepID=UPI000B514F57|nr:zinc-dependent alcohol dehydrogenase [Bdellovibrio sp. SKB1291214]UYL07997.1 glutathione-dependent formaldehyde dehydrogenase [Bdellovibrio sp. SKB1291214]
MKALCWEGRQEVAVRTVSMPRILRPDDVVIKITTAAICGSDLHLYNGYVPTMQKGDILGHENMGEVVEVGPAVKKMKVGDKIVVAFDIGCGKCYHCENQDYSVCDNSNPNRYMADAMYGYGGAAAFGYSHLYGGYAGGQAEYLRVPYADTNAIVVPKDIPDEKVLFLSDILPTAYMAAENCNIKRGDTVAIWGAGPVGQLAIRCAFMLGAERVISIDHFNDRLKLAESAGAETINFEDVKDGILDEIKFRTGGVGPDSCLDAVGLEAHGSSVTAVMDRTKAAVGLATDRPDALRQAIMACRKSGSISVPGVYAGFLDKFPFGAAFAKGLKFGMGQTHTQRYMAPLLERILKGEINPEEIISHRIRIDEGPEAYKNFNFNKDEYRKVVIKMH